MSNSSDLTTHLELTTSPYEAQPQNELSVKHPALSRYADLQKIGAGAQGTMLRAIAPDGAKVAIKVFDIQSTDSLKSLELFEREVDTIKNISVPGVPKFIEDIHTEQYRYLVEEYIDAPSLEKRMKTGQRFKFDQIVKLLTNACRILEEMYEYVPPVIHRDIKPANLLVDDEFNVSLVDFGVVAAKEQHSSAMTFAGTAGYLAPEQLYGKATPASDIFSLGVTMAHLVTGKAPCDMSMDGVKLNIDQYMPVNIPAWFAGILNQMIAPDANKRFQNGREVLEQIRKNTSDQDDKTNQPGAVLSTDDQAANKDVDDWVSSKSAVLSKDDGIDARSVDENNHVKSEIVAANDAKRSEVPANASQTPREVELIKKIEDVYRPLSGIVNDYINLLVNAPVGFLLIILIIFCLVRICIFDAVFAEFLLCWLPAVVPVIYILCGLGAIGSCLTDEDYERKCAEYMPSAMELNKIYVDEYLSLERTKTKNLPDFYEIFVEQTSVVPLSPDEDERLEKYIQSGRGPYPCLAYKPHTEKGYYSYLIRPMASSMLVIAAIVIITMSTELSMTWTIISIVLYLLSSICFSKYFKYIFTNYVKHIGNPEYVDAYQLFVRRQVSECRAKERTGD